MSYPRRYSLSQIAVFETEYGTIKELVQKLEKLPSGKLILRHYDKESVLVSEHHSYGVLEIGISYEFTGGIKTSESYYAKRRSISRRTYEKARLAFPDMPSADHAVEDFGSSLAKMARQQQRQNKLDAEKRLAESAESSYPRPASTNWLRVISGEKAHLVLFASRDWKTLCRERTLPSGHEWLHQFGFDGTLESPGRIGSVAKGLEVGFEVTGNRAAMLSISQSLLVEVNAYAANPPEITRWSGSVRPRRKPPQPPAMAWPVVLPPLIEFLSELSEPTVKIFNHHR